jgi:hypothetical protein
MRHVKTFFLIVCIASTVLGCKKDTPVNNCENLKNAVVKDAKDEIKSLVTAYINQLPSKAYSEQNINALASSFSGGCSISTLVDCYDCISTLPSMTEIRITVTLVQPNITKVADISYTSSDNKMKCAGVHD